MKRCIIIIITMILGITLTACSSKSAQPQKVPPGLTPNEPDNAVTTDTTGPVPPTTASTTGLVVINPKDDIVALLDKFKSIQIAPLNPRPTIDSTEEIARLVFEQNRGLYDDRVSAAIYSLQEKNYPAWFIGIWGISGFGVNCYRSYALAEVWYDNKWHMIDPNFIGYFYLSTKPNDILSLNEVLVNRYSKNLMWSGNISEGLELLGFIQAHFAITYGDDERRDMLVFNQRQ